MQGGQGGAIAGAGDVKLVPMQSDNEGEVGHRALRIG
jgi:hypothetical protein